MNGSVGGGSWTRSRSILKFSINYIFVFEGYEDVEVELIQLENMLPTVPVFIILNFKGSCNFCSYIRLCYLCYRRWSNQPWPRMAFTGDALLIRGCGRTDFQEGKRGL